MSNSVWATMSQIDVRNIKEKKNGFDYLSWAHAYRILKENVPHARVIKHTFDNGNGVVVPYMKDDAGYAYVQVSVDLGEGDVTTEIYPVTDFKNAGIVNPKSPDINNALQRCMAKVIAMASGIGLNLFYGEDLPRTSEVVSAKPVQQTAPKPVELNQQPTGNAFDKKQLHHLISIAPDIDALKNLFLKHQQKLDDFDKTLFTARKKELS